MTDFRHEYPYKSRVEVVITIVGEIVAKLRKTYHIPSIMIPTSLMARILNVMAIRRGRKTFNKISSCYI